MAARYRRKTVKPGYEKLAEVLDMALDEAQSGKGKARHANKQPFNAQIACSIIRREGHGFARGQALKKIDEAKRLSREGAIKELLGAINYLAADIVVMKERGY